MPTMTTEHSTNLILDDLATRNDNWAGLNYVLAGSTAIPLAMSSGTVANSAITLSSFTSGSIDESSIKSYTEPYLTISPNSTGALTIDLSSGNVFRVVMETTVTGLTISNAPTTEAVSFTMNVFSDSTATFGFTWIEPAAVATASTSITATSSCGFTGSFTTVVNAGDMIDCSGFSTATNNKGWRVASATTALIRVYGSSGITTTSAPSTGVTITRRKALFAGGSSSPSALTPLTPVTFTAYSLDADRWQIAEAGAF